MHASKADQVIKCDTTEVDKCEWVPCSELSDRGPLFSPMFSRISPIFETSKSVIEKTIEKFRDEKKTKEEVLKLMWMTNKSYEFRNRKNNMYMGKFLRDCMKYGSKL